MVFFCGIALAFAGFALLVVGQVKLPGGRLLKALPARLAGLLFLLFLPAAFGLRPLLDHLELRDTLEAYLLYIDWALFLLFLLLGGVLLVRGIQSPKRELRKPRLLGQPNTAGLFSDVPAEESPPQSDSAPRAAKGKRPGPAPRRDSNPFDFS